MAIAMSRFCRVDFIENISMKNHFERSFAITLKSINMETDSVVRRPIPCGAAWKRAKLDSMSHCICGKKMDECNDQDHMKKIEQKLLWAWWQSSEFWEGMKIIEEMRPEIHRSNKRKVIDMIQTAPTEQTQINNEKITYRDITMKMLVDAGYIQAGSLLRLNITIEDRKIMKDGIINKDGIIEVDHGKKETFKTPSAWLKFENQGIWVPRNGWKDVKVIQENTRTSLLKIKFRYMDENGIPRKKASKRRID
jgi:hypothetical protein